MARENNLIITYINIFPIPFPLTLSIDVVRVTYLNYFRYFLNYSMIVTFSPFLEKYKMQKALSFNIAYTNA